MIAPKTACNKIATTGTRVRGSSQPTLRKKSPSVGHRVVEPRYRQHTVAHESQRRDRDGQRCQPAARRSGRHAQHVGYRHRRVRQAGDTERANTACVHEHVEQRDGQHADPESARQRLRYLFASAVMKFATTAPLYVKSTGIMRERKCCGSVAAAIPQSVRI